MNKSNGFGLFGIIISTVAGVYRVGPGGERGPSLIAELPHTDQVTITARSLMPGKNYPSKAILLENAQKQQKKGNGGRYTG